MANKSVLELLTPDVRTIPGPPRELIPNSLQNLLAKQQAETQFAERQNNAQQRVFRNRYLATGDKAKALGNLPIVSNPVQPERQLTAADRQLSMPVAELRAQLENQRTQDLFPGLMEAGNNPAVDLMDTLPTAVVDQYGTRDYGPNTGLAYLSDPSVPRNQQRADITSELFPPVGNTRMMPMPTEQPELLPPSSPEMGFDQLLPVARPSNEMELLPPLDQPSMAQLDLSPSESSLDDVMPTSVDTRDTIHADLLPLQLKDIDPEETAVTLASGTTDGGAEQARVNKAEAGIVEPLRDINILNTAQADEFLGTQMAERLKPYIQGPKITVPEKTDVKVQLLPNPKAPDAQPNVAVPAVTKKNQVLAPLQKTINAELKKLQKESDPDSTMPFWNWLSDFSAGLRAAGKSGDQTVGAIAAGFANVRKGAKERAALETASRAASIKNISELAGAVDDLASITGAGNFGGYGTASGQFFKTPNLPRSGVVSEQMSTNANLNLDLVRNSYTFKTDKQNNVTVHRQELGQLEQVSGWKLDDNGFPTGKPEIFTKGSPEYNKALETHTFTEPDEIEVLANDADMRQILGDNYQKFAEKGSLVFVTEKAGQRVGGVRIENLPPGKWINLFNQETMRNRMVDASIPGEVEAAKADGFSVRMNFQADTPPRSRTSMLRGANTAARQSIDLVDRLVAEDDRRRAAGKVPLFGAIGGLKRTYQNFSELASDVGRALPMISFMGRDATSDYMLGMTPGARGNFDTMAAQFPIFKTMLVYALAKARKQDNSRLNQFDVAQARTDIDKLGALTSSRDIRAGLLAVKTQFQNVIDRNEEELKRIIGPEQSPKFRKREGSEYENIVKQLKQFKAKNDPNMEVYKQRFNGMYGPGAFEAERALQ